MINISTLKRHDRIWKVYPNGEIAEFKVWSVDYVEGSGWEAFIDWVDDDYSTAIGEEDQENFYYGEGDLFV